jgi:hypothetical protein
MSNRWVESLRDLRNFLSYVLLYAPDRFPEEDHLAPSEQMTLDRAFEELERGLAIVERQVRDPSRMAVLREMLARAMAAYRRGDRREGGHCIQDLEQALFSESYTGPS